MSPSSIFPKQTGNPSIGFGKNCYIWQWSSFLSQTATTLYVVSSLNFMTAHWCNCLSEHLKLDIILLIILLRPLLEKGAYLRHAFNVINVIFSIRPELKNMTVEFFVDWADLNWCFLVGLHRLEEMNRFSSW